VRNPFVAAKLAALALKETARRAAIICFQLGLAPRDVAFSTTVDTTPNKHSRHTVAQDKRAARKLRNKRRGS